MDSFKIKGEYIQLNQLLKVLGWVEDGAEANMVIDDGRVKVNGETELRRRNKIYPGMVVGFEGKSMMIQTVDS
jgi:ribosome-associated protein